MSTRSIVSCNLTFPDATLPPRRFQSLCFNPNTCYLQIGKHDLDRSFFSNSSGSQYPINRTKRNSVVYSDLLTGVQVPSVDLPDSWQGWLLGLLVTVGLPFLTNKWGPLLQWAKNLSGVVQTAEDIAEAVEGMAEKVDKIAEDIVADLPEGKLKTAVAFVENAAEEIAKDAALVDDLIDKVQEVEEKVEAYIEEGNAKKANIPKQI